MKPYLLADAWLVGADTCLQRRLSKGTVTASCCCCGSDCSAEDPALLVGLCQTLGFG